MEDLQYCFTILCWFLLYNNVNQSWLYIYIPSHLSLPPNSLSHPSRSSQITRLGFLCYIASSHCLSILHIIVNICQCYFLNLSHPYLPLLCPQVHSLHLCLHSFHILINESRVSQVVLEVKNPATNAGDL